MNTLSMLLSLGGISDFALGIFAFVLVAITIILFVIALMDLFKSRLPTNTKLLWLIVILIAPVLGSLIYLLVGRNQRINRDESA